jgi:hypothetical protein
MLCCAALYHLSYAVLCCAMPLRDTVPCAGLFHSQCSYLIACIIYLKAFFRISYAGPRTRCPHGVLVMIKSNTPS